jgi:hypothetical protein
MMAHGDFIITIVAIVLIGIMTARHQASDERLRRIEQWEAMPDTVCVCVVVGVPDSMTVVDSVAVRLNLLGKPEGGE